MRTSILMVSKSLLIVPLYLTNTRNMLVRVLRMKKILMEVLYMEMKFVKTSRYRVMNTKRKRIC